VKVNGLPHSWQSLHALSGIQSFRCIAAIVSGCDSWPLLEDGAEAPAVDGPETMEDAAATTASSRDLAAAITSGGGFCSATASVGLRDAPPSERIHC
jgi:hypothetical protein